VSASTYGSVRVRALLASCLTDAVRRHFLGSCLTDAVRRRVASLARPIARFVASLAGRIGAEVGGLPGLDAFLLICGSAFHDEAHGAFMALPPYTRTREGEAPPGSWPATLLAGPLS